jgi:TRAP-type C4-dicarboxylate transport system permease small subunit
MRVLKWLDECLEETLLVIFLAVISCVMLLQVVMRAIGNSLPWPEEFCRYVYVWTVFFSLGYTVRKGNMLRVNVVVDLLPQAPRKVLAILVNLGCLAVFAVFCANSWSVVAAIAASAQKSTAMGLPMRLVYLCTVAGFALATVRTAQAIVTQVRNFGAQEKTLLEEIEEEAEAEAAMAAADLKKGEGE